MANIKLKPVSVAIEVGCPFSSAITLPLREFTNTTIPRSIDGTRYTTVEKPPTPPFLAIISPTELSDGRIPHARPEPSISAPPHDVPPSA
jgi:hypothetical protein